LLPYLTVLIRRERKNKLFCLVPPVDFSVSVIIDNSFKLIFLKIPLIIRDVKMWRKEGLYPGRSNY
jgi:hypothetical protein